MTKALTTRFFLQIIFLLMPEERREIAKLFRDQQEKYTYYIIALSVTSIGFAVYKSSEQSLSLSHIPLGIAVTSWCLSIFFGFKFIRFIIASIYLNYKKVTKNEVIWGGDPNYDIIVIGDELYGETTVSSNGAKISFLSLNYFFYTGIILFIVWHVLEMYLRTK
jgi:hypothetical protein